MANKMLIDATHPEETRVVVLRGSRIEEFDFESASKRQLRGNIYLAKVIRVEPSLQAAFVDYGGNRHGFLAFSEVHPDYYQIPVSDRQALLADEVHEEHEEEAERRPRQSRRRRGERHASAEHRNHDEVVRGPAEGDDNADAPVSEHHQGEPSAAAPTSPFEHSDDPAEAHAEMPADEARPVHLDASETPPYDDPTPDLIQRASEVHDHGAPGTAVDAPAEPAEHPAPEPHGYMAADASLEEKHSAASPAEALLAADHSEDAEASAHATIETDAAVDTGSSVRPDKDAADESTVGDQAGDHAGHRHDDHESRGRHHRNGGHHHDDDADEHDEDEQVDQLGGDAMEEIPRVAYRPRRQYKIQEVIKRRQVLLVQVVKEERGNKGAALTTYLSLAGRYSVLMPNTARGGGISRKITDSGDRQRLKSIAQELEVPDGMGVILRTAGASRTKPEVKRDFEYLMRMWETVREITLASTAPKLVYEEGSLIKRAIRDLYNKDVEEVVVAGEDGYREAKDFMRLLMPSHAKNVQPWRDPAPLFMKAGAEAQLDAMFSNHVTLKSGGTLVINQTEALVAIDVNSGRSTREHNIEDTAVRTNLEAADEVARQLRLRDLAGLIVVDFIDMEESRNNRAVERRIKDALKDDRARIQIGRISHFGLLEMSRQRIRTGVLEGSTEVCQHCAGAGTVRSTASIALHVLRLLEDSLISDASRNITVRTRASVVLYILNNKRVHLTELEGRFGVAVCFENDEHLTGTVYCALERGEPATGPVQPIRPIHREEPEVEAVEAIIDEEEAEAPPQAHGEIGQEGVQEAGEETGDGRRRRRRRRGRGRDRESSGIADDAPQPADDALGFIHAVEDVRVAGADDGAADDATMVEAADPETGEAQPARDEGHGRRRRSRRGGRRGREERPNQFVDGERFDESENHAEAAQGEVPFLHEPADAAPPGMASVSKVAELPAERHAAGDPAADAPVVVEPASEQVATTAPAPVPPPAFVETAVSVPDAVTSPVSHDASPGTDETEAESAEPRTSRRPEPVSSELDPSRPKRSGWWQRAKATLGG